MTARTTPTDWTKVRNRQGFPMAVTFEGRTYHETGKYGTRICDARAVLEYRNNDDGDRRVWSTRTSDVYPD